MVALMLVPMLGATALAVDVGYWYYKQRDMQSAADSAAIAGAQTPDEDPAAAGYDGTNDNYVKIAKGTAAKYGYLDGQSTVSVQVARVTCPSGAAGCTQVTIGYTSPLFFSPIVGFQGNKNGAQGVAAVAVAGDQWAISPTEFCIGTLDTTPNVSGFVANGLPKADLRKCKIFSLNDMDCNGGGSPPGIGAGQALANGTIKGQCTNDSKDPPYQQPKAGFTFDDPYKGIVDKVPAPIPADPCGGNYPQAQGSGKNLSIGSDDNKLLNAGSLSGTVKICGDVLLTGNVSLNDVTLVIYNGRLITQTNTLTARNSTVVFTGSPTDTTYNHYPTDWLVPSSKGDGTLDISAPKGDDNNPWNGVAIYQDPRLPKGAGIDVTQAGNSPALNITGVVYFPNANVTLSGDVNKSGSGYACFVLLTYRLTISGTGEIFKEGMTDDCDDVGVDLPTIGGTVTKWLVK